MTPPPRFWTKVERRAADECWPWRGCTSKGYGRFRVSRASVMDAHRFAYIALVGPVPMGLQLDHVCRNRACVNPAHLEPVTSRENTMRGESPAARQARQTHCHRGHPLSDGNVRMEGRRRHCRACNALRARLRRAEARSGRV